MSDTPVGNLLMTMQLDTSGMDAGKEQAKSKARETKKEVDDILGAQGKYYSPFLKRSTSKEAVKEAGEAFSGHGAVSAAERSASGQQYGSFGPSKFMAMLPADRTAMVHKAAESGWREYVGNKIAVEKEIATFDKKDTLARQQAFKSNLALEMGRLTGGFRKGMSSRGSGMLGMPGRDFFRSTREWQALPSSAEARQLIGSRDLDEAKWGLSAMGKRNAEAQRIRQYRSNIRQQREAQAFWKTQGAGAQPPGQGAGVSTAGGGFQKGLVGGMFGSQMGMASIVGGSALVGRHQDLLV